MTLSNLLPYLILPALCYLLGSLSPAYLMGKLNGLDLRFEGSGHLGARNVGRVLGWKWGVGVLVADFLKGQLAVVVPWLMTGSPTLSSICAIAVVAGHNWSVFLEFAGGKGLAPGAGALFMLSPLTFLAEGILFIPAYFLTRNQLMAALVNIVALPFLLFLVIEGTDWSLLLGLGLGGVLLLSHWSQVEVALGIRKGQDEET